MKLIIYIVIGAKFYKVMKININIPEFMCDTILNKYRYVTEKVTLYYNEYDSDDKVDLRPVECIVAYPKDGRPEILGGEHPLMEDCDDIIYDRVVGDLFNNWLMNVLLMHDPV